MVWEGPQGQNMRPSRVIYIYIYILNATTIGFSENLFLVIIWSNGHATFIISEWQRHYEDGNFNANL